LREKRLLMIILKLMGRFPLGGRRSNFERVHAPCALLVHTFVRTVLLSGPPEGRAWTGVVGDRHRGLSRIVVSKSRLGALAIAMDRHTRRPWSNW